MRTKIADLRTDRCRLRISGEDRVSFLHGQCTQDIKRLIPGQACYAAFLNAKGKMRGDAYVVCRPDDFLLEASLGLAGSLEKFVVTEDVVIEDVSSTWGAWLIVEGEPDLPVEAVKFEHPLGTGVLSATALTVSMSAAEYEALRVEAGVPRFGVDMDEDTIPVEAGLAARAIRYDKGCYIGQETIARIKTYGHVNRQLVLMAVAGDRVPARGTVITSAGRDIGHVTSAVSSLKLGKSMALGYLRREFAQTGVCVQIQEHSAEVMKLCGH